MVKLYITNSMVKLAERIKKGLQVALIERAMVAF